MDSDSRKDLVTLDLECNNKEGKNYEMVLTHDEIIDHKMHSHLVETKYIS
jgi:phenolic acid decarboxylase